MSFLHEINVYHKNLQPFLEIIYDTDSEGSDHKIIDALW